MSISAGVNERVTNGLLNATKCHPHVVGHDYFILVLYFSIVCNGVLVLHCVLNICDLYLYLIVMVL